MNYGTSFKAQLMRIKTETDCWTQAALARFFGVNSSSVSQMIRRKTLTSNVLLKLVEKLQLNPEWVRTGKGKKVIGSRLADAHPAEIAGAVTRDPGLLSQIPSDVVLKEMLERANSIQHRYDSFQSISTRKNDH